MMVSSMVGYHYMQDVITIHGMYLILGISLIFFSIYLYKRITNYNYTKYIWLSAGGVSLLCTVFVVFTYLHQKTLEIS